jgi:hypothetical protein
MARANVFGAETPPIGGVTAPVLKEFDTAKTMSADGGITTGTEAAEARATLHLAAGIVVGSLLMLWAFGGIVFKDANL